MRGAPAQQGFPQEPQWQVATAGQEEAPSGGVHAARGAERPAQDHLCILTTLVYNRIPFTQSIPRHITFTFKGIVF